MPRLGAEYHWAPDEGSPAVRAARACFLDRIAAQAPVVLRELRDRVLPAYRDAAAADWPPVAYWGRDSSALWLSVQSAPSPALLGLLDALGAWALRWHLEDTWLTDTALSTLRAWTAGPPDAEGQRPGFVLPGVEEGTRLTLDVPALAPFRLYEETWQDFEDRVEEWKRANRQRAAQYAAALGLERTPEKRARRERDAFLHYEWLVRWHVQEWTADEIALEYGIEDTTTIMKAIRATAADIRLTLRTAPEPTR